MKLETLKDRIQKAQERIERKTATISKKEALIAKKSAKVKALGFAVDTDSRRAVADQNWEAYNLLCEINWLQDDIKRGLKEIEEIKANLERYNKDLDEELERESVLLKDIPDTLKRMQQELVERWDRWDIDRRNRMRDDYLKLGWKEYQAKYRKMEIFGVDLHFKDRTDAQIHESNLKDAKCLILNLYYRVREITGEITDWSHIRATQGTHGMSVLNGYVVGKQGRATVESILAGGYNIQRLHVRVLVKEHI